MAWSQLPKTTQDLFREAFGLNDDNETIVRTSATGEFSLQGLSNDLQITTFNVGDTEVKLPPSPLSGRNFLIIVNKSTVDTLYIGKSGVVAGDALGTTSGFEIPAGESFNIAIKDVAAVELYGIAQAGKTILVKAFEVS